MEGELVHVSAPHVLLLEKEADEAATMREALRRMEPIVRITTRARLRTGLIALKTLAVSCVVTDLRLRDATGVTIVRALREARRDVPVVVVSSTGSEEHAVTALKLGAADYVSKRGAYAGRLRTVVRDVLGRMVLDGADDSPKPSQADSRAGRDTPLVTASQSMLFVLRLVEQAASSAVPVLIEGETGTGKELIARAIHECGPRRDAPFLAQNCGAIADSLLESELFGHVRGAFTGADRDRRGLFEAAGEGTVFLDEVADASPSVQTRLLRVLQHGEIKPVGADRARCIRARVVAATNRPLEEEALADRFRLDLYYRLSVFPIRAVPLRHRPRDIPLLAAHFLRRFEAHERRETDGFHPDAVRLLQRYPWPGNVRELENEVHRLILSVPRGQRITGGHLARRIRETERSSTDDVCLGRVLERVEIALIRQQLEREPSKAAAARSLGITREALYAKMRRLGLTGSFEDATS